MISNRYFILIACIGFLIVSSVITFAEKDKSSKQNDASVNLIIKLDNIEAGTITMSQLSNVNIVAAMVINGVDGSAINYTVNSFTFSASNPKDSKDTTSFTENITGNSLTAKTKKKLMQLKPGSTIVIKNISATSPQNMNVSYGSTVWNVVADPTGNHK